MSRKMILWTVGVVSMVSLCSDVTANAQCICLGDINGDGKVNGVDIQLMQGCIGNPALPGCDCADINGDGRSDLLWWNSSTGQVYVHLMNGVGIIGQGLVYAEPNTAWKVMGPGTYGQ